MEMLVFLIRVSIRLQAWLTHAHTLSSVTLLQLSKLNISDNKLMGTLPSAWGSLEQVRMLALLFLHTHHLVTVSGARHGSCGGGVPISLHSSFGDWLLMIRCWRDLPLLSGPVCLMQ